MTRKQRLYGRSYMVWGLGKTGLAMATFLAEHGAKVYTVDSRPASARREAIQALEKWDVVFHWETKTLNTFPSVEELIVSPGVPYDLPALEAARAQGIPTIAAMQWAARRIVQPVVAVTGSAGKSTTVTLLGEMLRASGLRCFVGGNLGTPLIEAVERQDELDRIVIECSSFQLEGSTDLGAEVAVLTNLQPNHLDRHETMERYAECKSMLFRGLSSEAFAISLAEDADSWKVVESTAAHHLHFGWEAGLGVHAWLEENTLCLRLPGEEKETYGLEKFALRGSHNRANLAAAVLAARKMGASVVGVQRTIETFTGLVHRLEVVGKWSGVCYVNDSKATTPTSTTKAVGAFDMTREPLHLLIGGRSKGTGFREFASFGESMVRHAYLFGEAADEMRGDVDGVVSFSCHLGLRDALQAAHQAAKPGEVVLLSPGCTSYDEFSNFEERGNTFKRWVHELTNSMG